MAEPRTLPDELHDELDAAASRDPAVRHTLELIAGYREQPTHSVQPVARKLNAARGAELREAFIADAYTSRQVAELLDVADHRAVAGRRSRHTLLGWTIGNETYHPTWRFTDTGPLRGLGSVIKSAHRRRRHRPDREHRRWRAAAPSHPVPYGGGPVNISAGTARAEPPRRLPARIHGDAVARALRHPRPRRSTEDVPGGRAASDVPAHLP